MVKENIREYPKRVKKIIGKTKTSGNKFRKEVRFNQIGYCMSCKKNMPMQFAGRIQIKSGVEVFIGECEKCSTTIYKRRR